LALLCLGCGAPRPAVVDTKPSPASTPPPANVETSERSEQGLAQAGAGPAGEVAQPERVRRAIPDGAFPATKATCRQPARRFCRDGCASLRDFERTFDCHHVALQRCGPYRALTVMQPLAGFIALFDDEGKFVAGERWSDSKDECEGTATTAYYGPPIRCAAAPEFVAWCSGP
jgi:hypothetical protein